MAKAAAVGWSNTVVPDAAAARPRETAILMHEAFNRGSGGILMINGAHAWSALPDGGQQALRCLYQELTRSRDDDRDVLAVIVAGQADPLHGLLRVSSALAARFPAVIDFPSYTGGQLAAIFAALAREAGFTLAAAAKAAIVLGQTEGRPRLRQRPARGPAHGSGHRAPGPPDHDRCVPSPAPGHAKRNPGGRHPRAYQSA